MKKVALLIGIWAAQLLQAADYCVVVSKETVADEKWAKVIAALEKKHDAEVIQFSKSVEEALPKLRKSFPRYACFVARPQETTKDYVKTIHRMTRRLDEDPYTDLFWGVLTGRDADNALAIAKTSDPLVIRNSLACTEIALDRCEKGKWFCELDECSKVTIRDERKFVPFKNPKCKCGLGGIMTAEIGYQYPVEEAVANAHASKCLMRLLGKHTGYNGLMPYITEFIKDHHPLGYAEFECFRADHRFNLGQRIMTRLLRGDVSMPDTNILQHELIENRPLRQIKVNEEERFSGLLQTENAYNSPIIPDDMAEVPVYILNCNKFPQWGMYIDQFLS